MKILYDLIEKGYEVRIEKSNCTRVEVRGIGGIFAISSMDIEHGLEQIMAKIVASRLEDTREFPHLDALSKASQQQPINGMFDRPGLRPKDDSL